jgi:hypothetical protein
MADSKPKAKKETSKAETAADDGAPGGLKVKMAANPHPIEEIYVDGVSGILGRSSVCKLDCYRVVGVDREDDNAEIRRITHRLVIPTSAVPELLQIFKALSEAGMAQSGGGTK